MATAKQINVRAGDTEPLIVESSLAASEEIELADIDTVEFYAREDGGDTNHVDGEAMTDVSVESTQNGDVWDTTVTATFDPTGAKVGGGDAFDEKTDLYLCYVLITWTDGDETRHPASAKDLTVRVAENYE